jgi:peroxiredoxin
MMRATRPRQRLKSLCFLVLSTIIMSQFSRAAPPNMVDAAGKRVNLADGSKKAIVLIFVAHDCPISNAYAPEINRIVALYSAQRMAFYIVYPESGFSSAQARQHARDYGFRCPLLLDAGHRLVKKTGVNVTPEVAVLAPEGKVLYRGRVDDRFAVLGKPRLRATRHDLRLALEALSAHKPIAVPRTTATGCYIEG